MIKERIIQLIENKKLPKEEFYIKIGMTSASFRGKAKETPLNSTAIENILSLIPDVNPNWLITGQGEMLKKDQAVIVKESKANYGNLKPIPLVSVTAVGGFGNNSFAIEERDVKDYYIIPKFKHKKVDFMIEVEGSSMYPKYNSGDVVACTVINENSFIQWNKTHVIATKEQGIIIKRIKKGSIEDKLCMISDNKDYDAFEVPKEDITGIALVVGVIRLE
ncbi:Phage repressor protein C, contains Cro/C1-type HTH and peptisase s24 domains [Soonwooa buanensis]|uniref:Phage repressor protein C, contains Cro/C1-type HTH and peptisase s24 domains n=1 Tax=Soonwooa buanensis TaxID=619805 RepID=A0A1T5CVK9_9FLAO|nr:S24 family peptidase [Soonwooa buanensis]SKB63371.1 Phage repressor protein C, contains Cro/C1-type HTH and peptisase s24 domains [Soonwooa buanensis]